MFHVMHILLYIRLQAHKHLFRSCFLTLSSAFLMFATSPAAETLLTCSRAFYDMR